jgi:integrase
MASQVKRSGKWLSKPFKCPLTGSRKTKQFDTKELAEAYERACEEALRNGLEYLPEATTVTDSRTLRALTELTMSNRYAVSSSHTKEAMSNVYKAVRKAFGADTQAAEVLRKDILTRWVADMQDKAPATRNLYRTALKALVTEAAQHGICPAFHLDYEKVANSKERYLTHDEEDKLMLYLRDDIKPIVRFMLLTGLRISEALAARPEHMQGNVLSVVGKGTKLRRIPLTEEAQEILRSTGGWSWCKDVVQKQMRVACQRSGVEGVTPHTLRHTTASRLAQAGLGMLQLQQFMGHNNLNTTQRYAHLAPDWGDSVISLLDKR